MVNIIHPIKVDIDIEDRPYELGETINLALELTPTGDVEIRNGQAELICEVEYQERHVTMARVSSMTNLTYGALPPQGVTDEPKPNPVLEDHKDSLVVSSHVFLKDAILKEGVTEKYNIGLKIGHKAPPHAKEAISVKWQVVTTIDIAHAHDYVNKQTIKVNLG